MALLIFTTKLNSMGHLSHFIDEESKILRSSYRRHLGSDLHFHLNWVWAALADILGKEEFTGERGGEERGEGEGSRNQAPVAQCKESPLPSAVPGSIQSPVCPREMNKCNADMSN